MDYISIITINYNGYSETAELLFSLKEHLKCEGYAYEVIVVDNNSKGNDVELLKTNFPWAKIIESKENRGFSGGNNLGIIHSNGNYCFFINNDVLIDSDIIKPLLYRFSQNNNIAVVSPKILEYETKKIIFAGSKPLGKYMIRIHYYDDNISANQSFPIVLAPGTAMLVKKNIIDDVGLWPELFFLYEEELDWCLSIVRKGYEIWYDSGALIYHKRAMSTGKNSALVSYYSTRNRLLIYKRNLKGWHKYVSILFVILISIPQRCLKLSFEKRFDLMSATFCGLSDFLRGRFYIREKPF
jgi:GT2 family glycosyltransferase